MPLWTLRRRTCRPAVRRMLALVGSQAPFQHGRQQMEVLAGLAVTAKAVERTAEAIGGHIAQGEQREMQRALQLDLPVVVGEPIPILYVQMDGTGVPMVKKETAGRQGKTNGQPAHTREVKLGCVFTQTTWDQEGYPIRDPDSTTYTGAIENAEEFGKRIYLEAQKRGWSRARKESRHRRRRRMDLESCRPAFSGRASDRRSVSRAPTPVGGRPQAASQPRREPESLDEAPPEATTRQGKNRKAGSLAALHRLHQPGSHRQDSVSRPTTLRRMQPACATQSSAASISLSAPALSKPGAKP